MIFHNTKFNFFYYLSYRVGSTLLKQISEVHDEIKFLDGPIGLKLINENLDRPIYIVYREPETRFKSGLQIVCGRDFKDDDPFLTVDKNRLLTSESKDLFLKKLVALDNVFNINIPFVSGYSRGRKKRCFHLCDTHTDHVLWKALILAAYEYNVRLIPLNEYTKHLKLFYPKAIDILSETAATTRRSSFNTNNAISVELWEIYKKVFIENQFCKSDFDFKKHVTFNEWMDQEKFVFRAIEKYKESSDVSLLHNVITKLFEDRIYFSDIYSPNSNQIHGLLNNIHEMKKPIKLFDLYVKKYLEVQRVGASFNLGEYLPRPSVI
jgi:hypothetical protein